LGTRLREDVTLDRRSNAVLMPAFWLWLLLLPLGAAGAQRPALAPRDVDQLLTRGYELEQSGDWGRAVQLYEDAAKAHPTSTLLRERLRNCEIHYGLARRYRDSSFRSKLLTMPRSQALRLYDEVFRKIEESYVDPLEPGRLFRSGVEHLLVACDDEPFRRANLRGESTGDVAAFRERLRQWKSAAVRNRDDAVRLASHVSSDAERMLGLPAAPIVLEFVYGACDGLDDYSTCLTPDRLNDLYSVIDGNFVGIGVELRSDELGLLIVNVLPGGPAADAHLRAGDHIVAIESKPTAGLPTDEAANRLQGADGTLVNLLIQSLGSPEPHPVTLRRRPVDVQSVSHVQLLSTAEGIGYAQITGFQKSTLSELENAIARMERQGMRSLIMDLRGNPGGLLTSAVDISDKFLADGVIVTTRGRADGQSHTYRAHRSGTWQVPLVVLIDGDSASASEILAGALQDNQRATIVGTRSYGKGSVQSIFPLDTADAGIRLTTAKFYSPRGRAYSGNGVSPDIEVRRDPDSRPNDSASSRLNPAADPQLAAAVQASRQLLGRRSSR
jgi:carboxyl-terminal processing protease